MAIDAHAPANDSGRYYFFFDIDGTLACGPLGHRQVPEGTRDALARLRARGHFTAIATGRSHAMAMPFYTEQGFRNMVCDGGNGAVIDGTFLGVEPLDRAACVALLEECDAKGFAWAVSPDDSVVRLAPDERFAASIDAGYMETRVVPGLDFHTVPQFNKVYIACVAEDEPQLSGLAALPHARQTVHCLFVEPVDKKRGILRIMDHLKAPLSHVVVFGDGMNDLTMFDPRWTSIAMGNARDELKAKATYVTADADDDGIRKACERFGWI